MSKITTIPKALESYLNDHCMKCGLRLVIRNKKFYSYDTKTGKPRYLYQVACPNYAWWKIDILVMLGLGGWSFHEEHRYLVCIPEKLFNSDEIYTAVLEQTMFP